MDDDNGWSELGEITSLLQHSFHILEGVTIEGLEACDEDVRYEDDDERGTVGGNDTVDVQDATVFPPTLSKTRTIHASRILRIVSLSLCFFSLDGAGMLL